MPRSSTNLRPCCKGRLRLLLWVFRFQRVEPATQQQTDVSFGSSGEKIPRHESYLISDISSRRVTSILWKCPPMCCRRHAPVKLGVIRVGSLAATCVHTRITPGYRKSNPLCPHSLSKSPKSKP